MIHRAKSESFCTGIAEGLARIWMSTVYDMDERKFLASIFCSLRKAIPIRQGTVHVLDEKLKTSK